MKPMLAATLKDPHTDIPKWEDLVASPKLDGIRAIVRDGVVLSRALKPIPNKYVQHVFSKFDRLDGELIVGDPVDPAAYRNTMSGVMSIEGEPDVKFWVFDYQDQGRYLDRFGHIIRYGLEDPLLEVVRTDEVLGPDHFLEVYKNYLEIGYEGIMLRSTQAEYKHGRSTLKQGSLIKYKPIQDSEAMVIGFTEKLHNANEATTNELGYTARSSHKANMVPMNTLGALVCSSPEYDEYFQVGTGFDDATRKYIWENKDDLLNSVITFKHLPYGGKDRPRHPVFKGFREVIDL
jgi:DNA ligase-1